jgi:hypothetical protein
VHGDAGQVDAAGVMLDNDQRVDAPQENGIDVHEIGRDDAAGLGGQELLLGRAGAAGFPHVGLSVAMRITSLWIAAAVGGRPGFRRLV